MIPEFTQAIFVQAIDEWGSYVDKFKRLSLEEREAFLKDQGFASLHDLLAHVAVWWEEASGIIRDAIDQRGRPLRKYDFDEFNAASLVRFRGTSEAHLLAWYETQRQQMRELVLSLTGEQLKIRRIQGWLNGVILEHLKEHGLDAPRFLALDTLQREWGGGVERFNGLTPEQQTAFLATQGFARFRDVAAHIIAWWEDCLAVMDAVSKDPEYSPAPKDTDAYNARAVEIFGRLNEAEVWEKFEFTRQSLIELMINLPEEIFNHKLVQARLKSDVIEHYFQHAA